MSTTEITGKHQIEDLMADDGPAAMIDFWAGWCGPCRMMAPRYEKVAESMADEPVEFYKVDTEAHPDISAAFNVRSLPTVIAIDDGEIQDVLIGAQGERALAKAAKKAAGLSVDDDKGLLGRLFG